MPNIGDRKPLPPCALCGGEQYQQYESWSVYHNDTDEGWVDHKHQSSKMGRGPDLRPCLSELARRLLQLERR